MAMYSTYEMDQINMSITFMRIKMKGNDKA